MSEGNKIVKMSDVRREKAEHLRREYERILFSRILGCYSVIEKLGLKSIEMHDLSKSGCSFNMPSTETPFKIGEDIDLRFYFSNTTYLPARVNIRRVNEIEVNGLKYWQYGGAFDVALSTYPALEKFIDFVHSYADFAKEDKGDVQIWYF